MFGTMRFPIYVISCVRACVYVCVCVCTLALPALLRWCLVPKVRKEQDATVTVDETGKTVPKYSATERKKMEDEEKLKVAAAAKAAAKVAARKLQRNVSEVSSQSECDINASLGAA